MLACTVPNPYYGKCGNYLFVAFCFFKEVDHPLKIRSNFNFNLIVLCPAYYIMIYFALYTVQTTIISYCRIVYLNHIFHSL